MISDLIYCETVIPLWKEQFKSHLNVFTEKKVEVFHDMLRISRKILLLPGRDFKLPFDSSLQSLIIHLNDV